MESLPIWLDCDPGHDDMMAIMLASTNPRLCLKGISSTHGNQTVDKTYLNALRTTFLTGNPVPVYRGYAAPLVRESRACPEIHGESGLGGFDWAEIDKLLDPHPGDICQFFNALKHEIDEYYEKTGKKFTVVTTASFTNLAQFLKAYPAYAQKIRVVSMAGNFKTIGNIGPWSEFNVLIDPEATQFILDSGVWITFVPLDVTHTVLFTPEQKARVQQLPNKKFATLIVNLLEFFKKTYKEVFGFEYPPVHDPTAIFYLLAPEAFETVDVNVEIECQGKYTYGACCADWFGQFGREKNATVCLKVDVNKFWDAMLEALRVCAVQGGFK